MTVERREARDELEWFRAQHRQVVADEVWGDSVKRESTIRPAVSRLQAWLGERGVNVDFSVHANQSPPAIDCEILSVDEHKLQAATEMQ